MYADPPYINSDQGHYGGYTPDHFTRDLNTLQKMKGKFLLSSYPSDILDTYIEQNGWHSIRIDKVKNAGNGSQMSKRSRKIEVLTANYPLIK